MHRLTALCACLLALLAGVARSTVAPPGHLQFDVRLRDDRLAPLATEFSASVPPGTPVVWDFGDGGSGQGARVRHTFYAPGRYTVTASVPTPGGGQAHLTVEARSAGPEQARAVLLSDGAALTLDASASRVYAPLIPSWTVDGRPVGRSLRLAEGWHRVHLSLPGRSGPLGSDLRLYLGAVQTSVPFELEVLRLTNAARARGWSCDLQVFGGPPLPPLARSPQLDLAARTQASLMALNSYTAHVSPLDGSAPPDRVAATGYPLARVGENLAGGQRDPGAVVDAWLHSPGHCHTIMGDFREIGVAYAARAGSPSGQYWAQVFGTQAAKE